MLTVHPRQSPLHCAPPQGNILVDVPRWTPLLAQRLAALGGVRWIFLTHRHALPLHPSRVLLCGLPLKVAAGAPVPFAPPPAAVGPQGTLLPPTRFPPTPPCLLARRDDVGDHAAWAAHFGAQRIIHRLEVSPRQGTE